MRASITATVNVSLDLSRFRSGQVLTLIREINNEIRRLNLGSYTPLR